MSASYHLFPTPCIIIHYLNPHLESPFHEHHDFFLASQHPFATPAVRRLPHKYVMPASLWRHAIYSFLRNRLPAYFDYMLAFIYLAYAMMTLLLETVPSFEDTWIECLGDLGRYRMAIEDDDVRDRDIWAQVARQWYLKSAKRSPTTGRLYHHLAILAQPNALPQLLTTFVATLFLTQHNTTQTRHTTPNNHHHRKPPNRKAAA